MHAKLIDGKKTSAIIIEEIREQVETLQEQSGLCPGLAVVLVGDDPASRVYVNSKERMAKRIGIYSRKIVLPATASQEEVLAVVQQLNEDPAIHGILVQSPPPPQIDEHAIILSINPAKDVDGFHPINVGGMLIGDDSSFKPCTPWGCIELLKRHNIETSGKKAVVVGRSNIVGKPMAALLVQPGIDATVTICHSRTADLAAEVASADIVIAAVGRPEFIRGEWIKRGAAVIDVGINRVDDDSLEKGYRLCGDVEFATAAERASWITPVPGGVGPMTIAMLMQNTVLAFKNIEKLNA